MRRPAPEVEAVAWLAVEELDLRAADPAVERAVAEASRRLCAAAESSVCFLALRRPVAAAGSHATPGDAVARELNRAMTAHGAERLGSHPAFRTHAFVGIAAAGSAGGRPVAVAREVLAASGVIASPVTVPPVLATGGDEHWDHLGTGDGTIAALELARLPGTPVRLGWLAPLLGLALTFDLALWFEPVSPALAHRMPERRLRGLIAARMLEAERGRIGDARTDAGVDAAAALRERLARNEVRPLRAGLVAVVRAPDRAALRHDTGVLAAAAGGSGLRLRPAHLAHAAVAAGVPRPAGHRATRLLDSAAAATCLPLTETWCDDEGGYRLGAGRRTGLPVAVDVFDTAHHANANVAVVAASGHGKSFTLGLLLLEAATHGHRAVVIDPEGEYERLVRSCGGEVVRLGASQGGALNVFDCSSTREAAVGVAVDLVGVLCGGVLSEVERAHVDAALRAAMARAETDGRTPLLSDALEELRTAVPRAAAVVARACAAPFDRLFATPSDVSVDAGLVVLSLRDLPAELVPAATLLVASWLWTRVQRGAGRGHIVIDEVGALCMHAPLRALLVQLARRCRKYGASLVVATQNIEDLLRTEEGAVVATNCATVLLGGHRSAEVTQLGNAFGLTESQRRFLEHAGRGEFLLLAGRRRLEVRVDAPGLHADLLRASARGPAAHPPVRGE